MMRLIANNDRSRFIRKRQSSVFDPLSTSPYILLDPQRTDSRPLKVGGLPAGFMDLVAAWENPGSASDAVQATSASQPMYLAHTAGANYLYSPAVAGNYASVPDSAALDITGDITLQWEGVLPDFTPGTFSALLSKWGGSYWLGISGTGDLFGFLSGVTGGGGISVAHTLPDGQFCKIRFIRTGTIAAFYIDSGAGFVQVGANVVIGSEPITISTANINIMADGNGTSNLTRGKTTRARIWNTATPDVSEPVLDINFAAVPHRASSFVCASGQTVTINSTGNNPAVVVGYPMLRYDGVDDSMVFSGAPSVMHVFAVITPYAGIDVNGLIGNSALDVGIRRGVAAGLWYNGNGGDFTFPPGSTKVNNIATLNHADGARAMLEFTGSAASAMDAIGGYFAAAGRRLAMDMESIYAWPAGLTSENLAAIRSYLNTRHGLGLTNLNPPAPGIQYNGTNIQYNGTAIQYN